MVFEPLGDQARWRTLYTLLTALSVGDVLTYETMGQTLDLDPHVDRQSIQMAMRRAAIELEKVNRHAVDVIPNVGYRVVEAVEHLDLARRHQRKAGKALVRGHSKVVHVDLSGVDPEVRAAFQTVAQAFSMQMDMNRRFTARQDKLEAAVQEIAGQSSLTAEQVVQLRDRLDRLERERSQTS